MTPEIQHAIERLYVAFADTKRPGKIELSPVKDEADFAVLTQFPLRELTAEQLWQYSFSLFLTVGDLPDFDYFFPRIVEVATVPYSPLEIEVVFQKPVCAGWPDHWRKDRRDAFQAYLDAMATSWASIIQDIDSWVCAFSYCLPDLNSRLEVLLSGSEAANHNLIAFYEANSRTLSKHRLTNSFWERSDGMHERVVAWLERADVKQRIQRLYEAGCGSGTE